MGDNRVRDHNHLTVWFKWVMADANTHVHILSLKNNRPYQYILSEFQTSGGGSLLKLWLSTRSWKYWY